jgi:Zn-dependent peptidase ImmA (M78 family)
MVRTADINPKMLTWARKTAGLSLTEAAKKLGLRDNAKMTGGQKLQDAEDGERKVTEAFVQKAASVYSRPLVAFYLAQPPARGERGEDYRGATRSTSPREDALLDALVRDVRARQQMLREVLLDEGDAEPLHFVGSAALNRGAKVVSGLIRAELDFRISAQRLARKPEDLFAALRAAAERVGIYVLLLGDLGSYQTDIGENVFRGFALADDIAPFVVINDNDAVVARAFTLLHELAHIWIGASGVSGPIQDAPQNKVERFCNDVAGDFLLPDEAIPSVVAGNDFQTAMGLTEELSRAWRVSQSVVAYRLARNNLISEEVASELFAALAARWRSQKAQAKENRDPDRDGPSFYVVRRSRLGTALMDVVRRAVQGDVLTHTKAAKILGVNPSSVAPLLVRERPRAA